jgi:hypothetical protein
MHCDCLNHVTLQLSARKKQHVFEHKSRATSARGRKESAPYDLALAMSAADTSTPALDSSLMSEPERSGNTAMSERGSDERATER